MLYATLIGSIVKFGIPHSMAYFIPKHPERERVWVTQTALFILSTSSLAIITIYVVGDLIRANTSFDFVTALQLYILFFINLDFVEFYWLGKKRTDYVFYYSSGRLLARIVVVVVTAAVTESAHSIVLSLVVLEAFRCALVFFYAISRKWFTTKLTRVSIALQSSYFLPLGAGGAVQMLNDSVGMIFISAMIGVEALAFYVIGKFAIQIVNILRGAIADVIFPEIVELKHALIKDTLPLWQKATVWYCILIFPMAALFSYYADAVVTILFTSNYSAAIPVFAAFSMAMIIDCFDFHLPLRVQNANRFFVVGSIIAIVVNLVLLYPMYQRFGLIGPAVSFILSRLIFTIYLGNRMLRLYSTSLLAIVHWQDVGRVFGATIVCVPILIAGKHLVENLFIRGVLFGGLYLMVYVLLLRLLGVWDVFGLLRAWLHSRENDTDYVGKGS
jgi:O-antigen/teichoic acid export membrane protein